MNLSDKDSLPIYVDMDGTLIKTDIAQELILQCFKKISLFKQLVKLSFSGRSYIKHFLATHTTFSAENLPYNSQVIDYLKEEKKKIVKLF